MTFVPNPCRIDVGRLPQGMLLHAFNVPGDH